MKPCCRATIGRCKTPLSAMVFVVFLVLVFGCSDKRKTPSTLNPERLITIGGAITEIVFELGLGSRIVAVDVMSHFPKEVRSLPQVGYMRTLSAEGLLSMNPTAVIATSSSGPKEVFEQLHQSGINCLVVPEAFAVSGVYSQIEVVATSLGKGEEAKDLIDGLQKQLQGLRSALAFVGERKRVAFFTGFQSASFNAAGLRTEADLLLQTAGAENAFGFQGWKSLGAEGLLEASPDVILVLSSGTQDAGSPNPVVRRITEAPAFQSLRAVQQQQVFALDYVVFMQLGPRIGESAVSLARLIYPELKFP